MSSKKYIIKRIVLLLLSCMLLEFGIKSYFYPRKTEFFLETNGYLVLLKDPEEIIQLPVQICGIKYQYLFSTNDDSITFSLSANKQPITEYTNTPLVFLDKTQESMQYQGSDFIYVNKSLFILGLNNLQILPHTVKKSIPEHLAGILIISEDDAPIFKPQTKYELAMKKWIQKNK